MEKNDPCLHDSAAVAIRVREFEEEHIQHAC
jgi:hypothetical protein